MKRIYQHNSKKNAVGTYEAIAGYLYGSHLTLVMTLGTYLLTHDLTLSALVFVGIFVCGLYCNLMCLVCLYSISKTFSRKCIGVFLKVKLH